MKTELKYRTFDELLSEIGTDLYIYNNEGMIEPATLIKVAQKINYELGLKIHSTKEKLLDIDNKKIKLPDDFYVLNYAFLVGQYKVSAPALMGRHTEDNILDRTTCTSCGNPDETCSCEKTYTIETQNGEDIFVQVVEKRINETRIYDHFEKLMFASGKPVAGAAGYIKNNFIYTELASGRVYISYQGNMEDDDGNLLVLDHPLINEYYEYAIKQRLLENLYLNGEDVAQKLQLIEAKYRVARTNALSVANTPDFAEMNKLWELNRKAQYHKYVNMFKSSNSV